MSLERLVFFVLVLLWGFFVCVFLKNIYVGYVGYLLSPFLQTTLFPLLVD